MLSVSNLTVSFGEKPLFQPVSFSIASGSALQISGRNGVGKSTLLKVLAGLKKPLFGEVIHDQNTSFAYIGHELGLMDELTVSENMAFYQALYGKEIKELKEIYGLHQIWGTLFGDCSSGEKKRVALSRLGLQSARLWILDEVFTGLDKAYQDVLLSQIEAHCLNGGSIVFVSHQSALIKVHQTVGLS